METIKRYAISSAHTFITGFLIGIAPFVSTLTLASLGKDALKATILGLITVGVRAGIKAIYEAYVANKATKASQG